MRHLLFSLLFIPVLLCAQEDQRYLAGAVPEKDGKVVFTNEISNPSLSQQQLYTQMLSWANAFCKDETRRIAFQDMEKGEIAVMGREYLVFSSTALSLDRALMNYRLTIECEGHSCVMKLGGIRYEYNVSYQSDPEKYTAEEWITDKYALNKNKTKLNRISGKFRKATVSFADELFGSALAACGTQSVVPAAVLTPAIAVEKPMDGFVPLQAGKIPETILQLLPASKLMVSIGDAPLPSGHTAQWKGIGDMFGKTISTISVAATNPVQKEMDRNGIYRLNFIKPESADNTPWIIMECRKQGETSEGEQVMLIGEIINVWIK